MNGKILMKAIGGINERHIIEFADVKRTKKCYGLLLFKFVPAACFAAIVLASAIIYQSHNSDIQLPAPSNGDGANNVLHLPSDYSVDTSDPATSDSSSGITNEPSNPNGTTNEHPTTSDNNSTTNSPPVSHVTPGVDHPQAVYQGQKVNYNEARKTFDHSIVECTDSNFTGYTIGTVSNTGNHDGSEKVIIDIIYGFTNGTVTICDQDRMHGAYLYAESSKKIEYKGHTFMVETTDNEHIRYGYYPTQQSGLAYIAEFDKDTDTYEILDLILSLKI